MVVGMDLIITAAVDANDLATEFLHLLRCAFVGFTIPEVLSANHGDADGFPLKRQGFGG